MKKLFTLILVSFASIPLFAQNPMPPGGPTGAQPANQAPIPGTLQAEPKGSAKITGSVIDSVTRKAVEFATIALSNHTNNKPIDGTVCDEKGKFVLNKIEEGEYRITISFVGYQTKTIGPIKIDGKNDDTNLGTIIVSPSTLLLKEVVIEGQRSLIEEKVDRTVYNAEIDATNKGGDAGDVLRKVPMLSVDLSGNVTLRGSQNVRVLINSKPSTIIAGSVADALKQIPADMIKSVEVITSPSAKYDAEGSAGIINIITKKNNLQGGTLGFDSSIGLRGSNLSLNGSYRQGKMGFSLGGFGRAGYNVNGHFENQQRTYAINNQETALSTTTQAADTRNQFAFGQYQLGWDYDVNKNNVITASVRYGLRNNHTYQDKLVQESMRLSSSERSIRNGEVFDNSGTVDVNLDYTHTFKKPQQEFSLLTLYSRNSRTNEFTNTYLSEGDYATLNHTKNENPNSNQEITVQADYTTPITKSQLLEFGGKEIFRSVSSNYKYFTAEGANGSFIVNNNAALANVFNYNQNITSGYFSYTLTPSKTYTIKVGARYEYTTIDANFQGDSKVDIPDYGTLVPSVNVSKKLKNGSSLKASYNRRVQRPSLQFLNPNINASNPLSITVGNPELRPELTNNYELAYNTSFKNTYLTISTFMRNTNNAIETLRDIYPSDEANPTGADTIRTTYQNIGSQDAYGVSVFGNVNISNKFTLGGGTDAYYAVLQNNVPNPIYRSSNEGWVVSGRAFGSYTFTKGWGLQLFAFYRARQVQLQGYQSGFGIYSLSVKKDFKNKRGSVGVGAENFFTPVNYIRTEVNSPTIRQNSTNELRMLNFKVNVSYRIGKISADNNNNRRRKKSINNDDLKDGGDGSQQGGAPQGGGQPTPAARPK